MRADQAYPPGYRFPDEGAEAEAVLRQAVAILRLMDMKVSDLVAVKQWVTDWRDITRYNEVYQRVIGMPYPTRATVGSAALLTRQSRFQVYAIAVEGGAEEVRSGRLPAAVGPYAQGGTFDGTTFHSAAISTNLQGDIAFPGDVTAQTERALEWLATALAEAGLALSDLVQVGVTLTDPRDVAAFDAVYRTWIGPPWPARTVAFAPLAHPDLLVEVEAVAVAGGNVIRVGGDNPSIMESRAVFTGTDLYTSSLADWKSPAAMAGSLSHQASSCWSQLAALRTEFGLHDAPVVRSTMTVADWREFDAVRPQHYESSPPPLGLNVPVCQLLSPNARTRFQLDAQVSAVAATAVVVTEPQSTGNPARLGPAT